MKHIRLICVLTIAVSFCLPCFAIEDFSLPVAEPKEIKEKSSLEEPVLNKSIFFTEEYTKEIRAFYPSLFPAKQEVKEKHMVFVKQGSFDHSVLGFDSSVEKSGGYYYQLGFLKDASKGEKEYFEENKEQLLIQLKKEIPKNGLLFGYVDAQSIKSQDSDTRQHAAIGTSYEQGFSNYLRLKTSAAIRGSLLFEQADYRSSMRSGAVSAEYLPLEFYYIESGVTSDIQTVRLLSDGSEQKRILNNAYIRNGLSLADYASIICGYSRIHSNNFGYAMLTVPLPGNIKISGGYEPQESMCDFERSFTNGFRVSGRPDIQTQKDSSAFSEQISYVNSQKTAGIKAEARQSKTKNYLSFWQDGLYLKPVFISAVEERKINVTAYLRSGIYLSELSAINNDVTDIATGEKVDFIPDWKLSLKEAVRFKWADVWAKYTRESARNVYDGVNRSKMGSFDVVSAGAEKSLFQSVKITMSCDNIFSKEYGDRLICTHKLPNFTIGLDFIF